MENNGYLPDVMKSSIFADKKILDIEWVPPKEMIVHIEDKIKEFAFYMSDLLKGSRPPNILIFGPVGTGKTLMCRLISDELKSYSEEHTFRIVHIKCGDYPTEFKVLTQISLQMGLECKGTRTNVYYEKLDAYLNDRKLVVVLDEIDKLETGNEVLFSLTRMGNLSVVGISNDLTFMDSYDPRTKSSLGARNIVMDYYNATHIMDILKKRAGAFREGALASAVIPKCSALAAQEHGDARKAMNLLRAAGEAAEKARSPIVTEEHMDAAERDMDIDIITTTLKSSPAQMKILFYAILDLHERKESLQTSNIMRRYEEVCTLSGRKAIGQRRVNDLIAELDLRGMITRKVISLGRYGKTTDVKVWFNPELFAAAKRTLSDALGIGGEHI